MYTLEYTLMPDGIKRKIEHRFKIGDKVIYNCPNGIKVDCNIERIHVTFNGIRYLTNKFKWDIAESDLVKKEI